MITTTAIKKIKINVVPVCKKLLIIQSFTVLFSCGPIKVINCPPKFTIYKNVNKAYPSYARELNMTLSNTFNTANKISDTSSITLRQNTIKLKDNINNITSRFEDLIKSNLMIYFASICDESIRRKFADSQSKLAEVIVQLSETETKMSNSAKSLSNDSSKSVEEAVKLTDQIIKNIKSGEYKIE